MDKIYDINIKSNVLLAQSALPYMGPGSSMLFINSISAFFPDATVGKYMGMYAVTKTAMLGMVKALSQDYADRGVRVNGIAAGIVPTNFGSILTTPEAKAHYVRC
jgi:NAD(P)-dependent dehydrogenase (short-subunit alcohol dehydrogenase family)